MAGQRVLLVVMPFLPLERPALGPALLKRELQLHGFPCDLVYLQFRFADLIGFNLYERIAYFTPTHDLVGEWIFTRALHTTQALPAEAFNRAVSIMPQSPYDRCFLAQIEYCRTIAPAFVRDCAREIDPFKYDIVGFSTSFQQNVASLAMARELKRHAPGLTIVFGGANCEGEMGQELHRSFNMIDFVCAGDGDESFPELVAAIREYRGFDTIPGIVYRRDGKTAVGDVPPRTIDDLDALPVPDHSDFLDAYRQSTMSMLMTPQLTIETSRGCWWGQKHPCTFCGLNGLGVRYRAKSPERAYDEIVELVRTYGIRSFFNTDNILNLGYFNSLFPKLAEDGFKVELYYESKANLKKHQLVALRRTGTKWIQPGIESLSTHVLKLMGKGVKAIQNVQVLKWIRELGLRTTWNVICGFPGERPEDYHEFSRIVRLITHLQPPASFSRFRVDRFSPIFNDPKRFGLQHLRPFPAYELCYPLPERNLRELAYYFAYDNIVDDETLTAIIEAYQAVVRWRQAYGKVLLTGFLTDSLLAIFDGRLEGEPRRHVFAEELRAVYLAADKISSARSLEHELRSTHPQYSWNHQKIVDILEYFEQQELVLREDEHYLSLALINGEPDDHRESAGRYNMNSRAVPMPIFR